MTIQISRKGPPPVGQRDTSQVPFRMTTDSLIPTERYTSQAFHDLEMERLWMRSWQVACREEEIPRPGDFVEYTLGDENILVVRNKAGEVRAFVNACRHRGTQLGQGCGSYPAGKIVCPFHGWEFDLDGNCTYVYAREGFDPELVTPDKIALEPVRAETKWGMVWVNFDLSGPSLDEQLGDVAETIDPIWLDKMRVRWWKQIRLKANWKTAQEAFFESYHVMQAHPEMTLFGQPDDMRMEQMEMLSPRSLFEGGHWTHYAYFFDVPEDLQDFSIHRTRSNTDLLIERNRALWVGAKTTMSQQVYDIQEAMLNSGVPADDNFPAVLAERVAADYEARGVPYPPPHPKATSWSHVFPNLTFLYSYASVLMYRSRPDGNDPNACIFDFWSLETVPEDTPVTRPTQISDEMFETMWLVHQDKGNIERMQVGLKTRGHRDHRLAKSYEETINFFHRHLDQELARPPGE